jgi:hypothetical protein
LWPFIAVSGRPSTFCNLSQQKMHVHGGITAASKPNVSGGGEHAKTSDCALQKAHKPTREALE